MKCLNELKIHDYIEGNLSNVENSIIRDHLIVCEDCNDKYLEALSFEDALNTPHLEEPPASIEKFVMSRIYSNVPTYSSVLSVIALSFITLVSWVYIYFDFANNSLVQAFQITKASAYDSVNFVIKMVTGIFTFTYTLFRAFSKVFNVIFNVNISTGFMLFTMLLFVSFSLYFIYRNVVRYRSNGNKA